MWLSANAMASALTNIFHPGKYDAVSSEPTQEKKERRDNGDNRSCQRRRDVKSSAPFLTRLGMGNPHTPNETLAHDIG